MPREREELSKLIDLTVKFIYMSLLLIISYIYKYLVFISVFIYATDSSLKYV